MDDPRRLREILDRALDLAQRHSLTSVLVGIAGGEDDPLFPEVVAYVESGLRVDDSVFRMTRERVVLLLDRREREQRRGDRDAADRRVLASASRRRTSSRSRSLPRGLAGFARADAQAGAAAIVPGSAGAALALGAGRARSAGRTRRGSARAHLAPGSRGSRVGDPPRGDPHRHPSSRRRARMPRSRSLRRGCGAPCR